MPAVFQRTMTKFLPQEFVASQEIVAHYMEKDYRIWRGVKRTHEENSEARGNDLVVFNELDTEQAMLS